MALLFPSSFHCTIACYFRHELILHLKTLSGISPPHPLSPPAEEVGEREASKEDPKILGAHLKLELEEEDLLYLNARISTSQNKDEKHLPQHTHKYKTLKVKKETGPPRCWTKVKAGV